MKKRRLAIPAISLTFLTACSSGDCVSLGGPGLAITVVDEATQRRPISTPTLTLTFGNFVETPGPEVTTDPPVYRGAYNEGTYQLRIEAAGYESLIRDNIAVRAEGVCHVLKATPMTVAIKKLT